MKIRQLFIGIGLSCALALSACEEVIEVEPEFQKDATEIFTTLEEYEFALTGTYALFRQVGYYGNGGQTSGTWSVLPDMMSDNVVQTGEDLANFQDQTNWVYAADDDDIDVAWQAAYLVITQANIVLQNLDQFAAEEPQRVNRISGQALAIRGMVHFDLLRYWGVEFDRNSTALGVPYKISPDYEEMPSRLSVKETYDNIFRDLEEAEILLGDVDQEINAGGERAYIDQLVVQALLARINLYARNYTAAADYASLVIAERPLASREQFADIWTDDSNAEVIWAVAYSAGEGSPSNSLHNGPSNRNRYRPAADLVGLYQPTDVRLAAYIGNRELSGTDRVIVNKFLARNTTLDNLVNWKVLRTGEMYLIRAEARAMSGDPVGALLDLNTLRAARISNPVPVVAAGQGILDAVAEERRRELFAEGHRWFDLKRTTRSIVRADCELESTTCELGPDAREWVWPIPQVEIDTNPNINQDQQTPGY